MRWMTMTAMAAAVGLPMLAIEAAQTQPLFKTMNEQRTERQGPRDVGPWTPEANAAHRGGGVILEGKPGAPAPEPRATSPAPAGSYAPLVVGPATN